MSGTRTIHFLIIRSWSSTGRTRTRTSPCWTVEEGIALSFGKNPRVVNWAILSSCPEHSFAIEYRSRLELAVRAKTIGDLQPINRPADFIRWAKTNGIEFAAELEKAVNQAPKLNVKDLGAEYETVIRERNELASELTELKRKSGALLNSERKAMLTIIAAMAKKQQSSSGDRGRYCQGRSELGCKNRAQISARVGAADSKRKLQQALSRKLPFALGKLPKFRAQARYHCLHCDSTIMEAIVSSVSSFSQTGFVRLKSILAPTGPIPVSKSTWWAGVKSGRFPKPVKLGHRITVWRAEDILALIEGEGTA
jgi:prophage regulatory protein